MEKGEGWFTAPPMAPVRRHAAPARTMTQNAFGNDSPAAMNTADLDQGTTRCPAPLRDVIAEAFAASPLLAGLDPSQLDAEALHCRSLQAGDCLFEQGEDGDHAYLIVQGILGLYRTDLGMERRLFRKASRGNLIGEYALLCGEPRSAKAEAITDCLLVVIDQRTLDRLLTTFPFLQRRLIRQLAMAASHGRHEDLAVQPMVLVVAPSAELSHDVEPSFTALIAAFAAMGAIEVVDHRHQDWPELEQTSSMISAVQDHRPTVFLVDRIDRIHSAVRPLVGCFLLICNGNQLRREDVDSPEMMIDVLRVWPDDQIHPDRLENSTELKGLRFLYNARLASSADFLRVARCILGKANILVLGGGGAKGFAHVGALKALEEKQALDIDMIYGVSIGALIGSLYALERSVEEVRRELLSIFVDQSPYSPTLPVHSLFRYNKGMRRIEALLKHHDVGDTWIPFRAGSVNITTNTMTYWHNQSLMSTVLASMSIPGMAPPVSMPDGGLYVDGAVLNNLPIFEARRHTSGKVIAISLDHGIHQRQLVRTGEMNAWIMKLLDRIGLAFRELPPITVTIMQSMLCSARSQSDVEEVFADLMLKPNLTEVGLLDWAAHDKVEQEGYLEMGRVLESVPSISS